MKNSGLISVIVPVYNVEKYLRECIESVLAQTYQNWEMILVDDGSEDSSGEICDEYAKRDTRIKVFYKKNGGASSARNYGLDMAQGEYIYFLDSDDWLTVEALEKLIESCVENKAEVVFFSAYSVEEETGKKSTAHYSYKNQYLTADGYQVMETLIDNKDFHVAPWLFFIKKELLDRSDLRFEEGIIYEDMIFTYKLFCVACRVSCLSEYLYYRRYRENSVMTSKITSNNFLSALKVYYKVHDYWTGLPESMQSEKHVIRCAYNGLNVYMRLNIRDKKACSEKYKYLKKDILSYRAYDDRALQMRCYGQWAWIGYKLFMKLRK